MMRQELKDDSAPIPKRPRVERDEYEPSLRSDEPYKQETVSQNSTGSLQTTAAAGYVSFAASGDCPALSGSGGAFGSPRGLEHATARSSGSVGSDESANSRSQSNSPEPLQDEDPDDEDEDSPDSNDDNDMDDLSELSNLSGLSEEAWQPVAGPISWVQRQMVMGQDPRAILQELIPPDTEIPEDYDQLKLWKIIINLLSEPPPREKLPDINTLEHVVELLKKCNKIIVLTGAGVSVSCGIPDFRSRDGIYARLAKDFPNLPDPQAMFDIDFFRSDQRPFFKFAKEIYPGQFEPSRCHKFIKLLETKGKLLRNYTQNIDTLEKVAGVQRVIECHGSFATATCMVCKYKVDAEDLRKDIFDQVIPRCPRCPPDVPLAVMKPDIVFFGESLPGEFHRQMASDKNECDLLIVIGSSLKVRPVALIPNSLPASVAQIIINREPLHKRLTFDVELLGNCDDIVSELCKRLGDGWDHLAIPGPPAEQLLHSDLPVTPPPPSYPAFHPVIQGSGTSREIKFLTGLVDHSADSGLGDVEAVSSTETLKLSDSKSLSQLVSYCESGDERLERLSSSDSGVETTAQCVSSHGESVAGDCVSACPSCGGSSAVDMPHVVHTDGVSNSVSSAVVSSDDAEAEKLVDIASYTQATQMDTSPHGEASLKTDSTHHKDTSLKTDVTHHAEHTTHTDTLKESRPSATKPSPHHHQNTEEPDSTSEAISSRKRHECRAHSHTNDAVDRRMDLHRESQKDNAHCSHTDTIDEIRRMWVPRRRLSWASRVDEKHFMFVPPNRYIFCGAEVYSDDSDSDSDDTEDGSLPSTPSQIDDTEDRTEAVLNTLDEALGTSRHVNSQDNLPVEDQEDGSQPPEVSSSSAAAE